VTPQERKYLRTVHTAKAIKAMQPWQVQDALRSVFGIYADEARSHATNAQFASSESEFKSELALARDCLRDAESLRAHDINGILGKVKLYLSEAAKGRTVSK
jgi:hypothetical protein